jgi:probable rRNA maturation factor
MSLRVEFVETSRRWRGALPARALAREAIAAALRECGCELRRGAEVCVHLVGDADIRALNKQWRGRDAATNVLSFPAAAPEQTGAARLLGDIFVAFETVSREAEDDGTTLADHLRHLVVHGFLHLLGFDHDVGARAEAMEALEVRILSTLGVADPYESRELTDAAS